MQRVNIQEYINKLSQFAHFCICKDDDSIDGFVAYYLNRKIGQLYISLLAVAEKVQGTGLSKEMMKEIISVAQAHNLSFIGLEVSTGNLRAYNYYQKQGFIVTGETPNKYTMCRLLK